MSSSEAKPVSDCCGAGGNETQVSVFHFNDQEYVKHMYTHCRQSDLQQRHSLMIRFIFKYSKINSENYI
jgi:hypothetical protein